MSKAQLDRVKENMISKWRFLSENWDGKDLSMESEMEDIAGELEAFGIIVEDL